jgi:luciferase family oxidoreductase group 1
MNGSLRLGAHDLCKTRDGRRHADVIWDTLDLVPKLEQLGYTRYWLAEHHNPEIAQSSPEILIPILAGITDTIRVGAAGILLRYHAPFKVAKDFRLLHAIFPHRIDLGLARGGVPDLVRELLIDIGGNETPYEDKVAQLLGFLRGTGKTSANPTGIAPPDVWLLGSKSISAALAAHNGTSFCFARFLEAGDGDESCREAISHYRDNFRSSTHLPEPQWCVAVAGACASSERKAQLFAGGAAGQRIDGVVANVIGDPEQCRSLFVEMSEKYATSEFVFLDLCRTQSDRLESYRLLAEALNLRPRNLPRTSDFQRRSAG